MTEPQLFVPCSFSGDKFELCWIDFPESSRTKSWGPDNNDQIVKNKLNALQQYFQQQCKDNIYGRIINIRAQSGKEVTLDNNTPSVFLGIFIKAAHEILNRNFKKSWDIIIATGDIISHDGMINAEAVGSIEEKFESVKNHAKENLDKKHLFLYVYETSEAPIEPGWHENNNIEVIAFSASDILAPNVSIGRIFAGIFEPIFTHEQEMLLGKASMNTGWEYISTSVFEQIKIEALSGDWKGFFIHGEGESGKSAMAFELAKYLTAAQRIYAPIWIKLKNDELFKELSNINETSHSSKEVGRKKDPLENHVTANIACLIAQALNSNWKPKDGLSALVNLLKRDVNCPYLLIIDNLEMKKEETDKLMESFHAIMEKCSSRLPVIFTSRTEGSILNLKKVNPSELNRREIEELVWNIAEQDDKCKEELSSRKGEQKYEEFLDELHAHFASYPGVITVIVPLLNKGLPEVLGNLKELRLLDKDVNKKTDSIFTAAYSDLDEDTRLTLAIIINLTLPWIKNNLSFHSNTFSQRLFETIYSVEKFSSRERILSEKKRRSKLEIEEIVQQAIDKLLRTHLIYRDSGKTGYYIKTLPLKYFLFSKTIKFGDKPIRSEDLITACIYYGQSAGQLENILKECHKYYFMRPDSHHILFLAAILSESPEYLNTLYNYGYKKINTISYNNRISLDEITVLHAAARHNQNEDVIKWFLDKKANVSIRDKYDRTPLHFAAEYNRNPNIITLLINYGAKTDIPDYKGWTPIYYAARNKNPDIFKLFVELDKRLLEDKPLFHFIANSSDPNIIPWLEKSKIDINKTDSNTGAVLLHAAAMNDDATNFKKLIEAGAKTDITINEGDTIMHFAATNPNLVFVHDIIDILLEKGADIHAVNTNGETPLHIAAEENDYSFNIQCLLEKGAITDINAKTNDFLTPLHLAAAYNENPDIIDLLIDNGADISAQTDAHGEYPIHAASAFNTEPAIVKALLNKGADVNAKDNDGETPLHYAALYNKNPEVSITLIKAGANIDAKDNAGKTALSLLKKRKDWRKIKAAI
ncbi:MAG: ankyrin repeat domain-containing protein [Treponema sp.]|nr:ankyrin repeat domain-containing protein [Treponema sp.]